MALTVIKPSGIDISGNYTVNGMNVSANASIANLTITNSSNLGAVGNIYIGGGTSGQYLQTDGSGVLSWVSISSSSTLANGNSNVNIPSANGNVNISSEGNANILVITGTGANITGTLNTTGNANVANLGATGIYATTLAGSLTTAAQPNITSVGALSSLGVTGNITSGNANLGNAVNSNYFIGNLYGTANLATYATTANSVAGANVSGEVSFAATANSVAGSNVSGQVANALVAGTVYTNAQPNITSVGTLTSLDVTGNITAGNISAGSGTGGNISGGNVISANTFIASGNISAGNANLGNAVTANYFLGNGSLLTGVAASNAVSAGTVTTNAQPNITSVGILTSLNVSGNANTGNLGTNNFIATGTGSFGGNVNMNTNWINNVGYPSVNTDVATKIYVDTMVSTGIAYHQPVQVATTGTLATATGGTITYNNGTAGVGANLVTTGTFLLIDGSNVQTAGTRILVKNEANAAHNGVYEYTSSTVITRTTDADEYGPDSTTQLSINDYFFVQTGTVNEGIAYIVSAPTGTITFGTSNITFAEFSTSQVYNAGTGLTLTGTTFSISNTTVTSATYGNGDRIATFTVNEQGQLTSASNAVNAPNAANLTGTTLASGITSASLTSVGTLTSLGVSGTITAASITANTGVFTGNGNGLSSLVGANVTGQVGNALVAGTVYTNAQPNITSIGTLSNLTSNGTVDFTNASNVSLGPVGNVHITGGSSGQYLSTDGSGTLSWATVATGSASISNGNSNVNIPAANGNVNISAVGNANVLVITGTGANITGTANISGNLSAGNIIAGNGSGGNISNANVISANTFTASGNITASNANLGNAVTANYFLGNGSLLTGITSSGLSNGNSNVNIPSANGNVNITAVGNTTLVITGTGANITGTLNTTGNANVGNLGATGVVATTLGGSLTTASQPNITSVGTLTSLGVSGTITAANITANTGVFTGNGNGLSSLVGANVTGQVGNALVAGTVYTAAQPNITSVGSLTGLTVSNATGVVNFTTTANVTLGAVANLHISGGSANYILQTDGAGNLTWAAAASGSNLSNGNSNVNIPAANGNVNISAVGNANVLVITGTGANITGTANITGNLSAGNIIAGNGSGGNISNANVISANTFIASGNITAGNANLGNSVTANFFTGNGVYLTGITTAGVSNGNSNVNIPSANGNVNITAVGNTTVVITGTGINVAGTLNATGNITGSNASLGNSVTANYFVGNLYGTANLATYATTANAVAGANVSGQVANALIASTVTTNAQPNITSVGTLSSLIVSGTGSFSGNVNLNSFNITSLATPVASTDAATKQYVDDVAQGLNVHDAVQAATPDTLANVTSGTITYNNGSSGVGANLTTTGSFNLIDGVNVQTSGTRILVKNEANSVYNGIYTWSNATVITRATDYNSVPEVEAGDFVFVSGGTLYDNTGWVQTSTVTAIGTAGNNIEFTQFSGAGTYTAGTGLTLTGSTFSISNTAVTSGSYGNGDSVATFTVNSQGQLTAASNTAIAANAANLTGTSLASTIVTSNLTSVGNLTGLTVSNSSGVVNLSNTANVTLGTVGNIHISGGTANYILKTDGAGNLSWTAPPDAANVTVDNFTGNGVQTVFTLSTTPIGINQTSVNYNGATVLRTDYSLANANITFSSAPANGSAIEVTTINLTSGGGGGGGITAQDLLSPFLLMGA